MPYQKLYDQVLEWVAPKSRVLDLGTDTSVVDVTAGSLLVDGERFTYALCRPPGHHAERRIYGGFCFLNNAAIGWSTFFALPVWLLRRSLWASQ